MENFTENSYLELANQMKEIVDDKDKEVLKHKKKLEETKKLIMKIYGLIDYIREIISNIELGDLNGINIEDMLDMCIYKIEKNIL